MHTVDKRGKFTVRSKKFGGRNLNINAFTILIKQEFRSEDFFLEFHFVKKSTYFTCFDLKNV